MQSLKIKVNNEAESKEAQELLFELGYKWHGKGKIVSCLNDVTNGEFGYLVAWSTGCFTNIIQMGCGSEDAKEITLAELRNMTKPMQEYLNKNTYEYKLAHSKPDGEWISIPEGANYAYKNDEGICFLKNALGSNLLAWQRPTQPEALPFIDDNPQSLNEQYAEIEQVRQAQIGGNHYSKLAIQPMEYSLANGLDAGQHTVIKYVTRFKDKGGIEDLQKAKHTIDLLIANYYGVEK